jgi:F-type H+-transporting ATPase subunit c
VSLGQGIIAKSTFDAMNRQPAAHADITRATLVALALVETGAILGMLMALWLFFAGEPTFERALAELGIGFAMAVPGLVIGYASSLPAYEATTAIARQPFLAKKIFNMMLLMQALIQTPLIFGFIISLTIRALLPSVTTVSQGLGLLASGLAIGVGSIGPALGSGYFTSVACQSAGRNKFVYSKLFTFTFISQAIVETPVIFAAIISLFLTTKALSLGNHPILGYAYIAFAACVALGTLGAGISSGRSAAAAATQIALNPQSYTAVSRASIMAQGLIDTCAIYAFIISLWLLLLPLT